MVRVSDHSNGKAHFLECIDDHPVGLPHLIQGLLPPGIVSALENFDFVQIPNPTLTFFKHALFFLAPELSFAIPM